MFAQENLVHPDVMRVMELLSVGPAFVRGLVEKQVYLSRIYPSSDIQLAGKKLLTSTDPLFDGSSISPGGFYTGIWGRDASYILNELLQIGKDYVVSQWLGRIWRNRISPGSSTTVVHGRGSPEMEYRSVVAKEEFKNRFIGLLPTSIQH